MLVDFKCRTCGRVVEKIVSRSEPEPTLCELEEIDGVEGCGSQGLERVPGIGRTSFSLKGSGWGSTGYS